MKDGLSLSIVIPTLNRGRYIKRALDSIFEQGEYGCEVIIMDGGSTDETVDIIDTYKDKIAYWVSEPDSGQAHAIRKGFKVATRKYLCWLNSDDFFVPGAFSVLQAAIANNPHAEIFFGNEYLVDDQERIIGERRVARLPNSLMSAGFRFGGFGIYQPASFWSADFYEMVGGVDSKLSFAMDTDLFVKFALASPQYVHLGTFVVSFRIHEDSKTTQIQDVAALEFDAIRSKYRIISNGIFSKTGRTFIKMSRIISHLLYGEFGWLLKRAFEKKNSKIP